MMKPLSDRVIAKRTPVETQTASGIYLPEAVHKKKQTAEVVAVGAGKLNQAGKRIPLEVKIGDIIFFNEYAGLEFNEFIILREDEILGIVQ